jgi:8-oxo-dGTP diphosphatase
MLRSQINELVQSITPIDTTEAAHKKQTLDWINSGADLFRTAKPATPPMHLVSYFAVIDESKRKILLVDHIKAQMWLLYFGVYVC